MKGYENISINFPYKNESDWLNGFEQLTNSGKIRMYNLGVYLRERYNGFLTDNIREIYARSRDLDRCIESTQLVLNGAYKPKGDK
jgi:hypothetical protein